MTSQSSQRLESLLPIYDTVPSEWADARPFFVENLKKISEGVNVRDIAFYLDEELLTGGQFIGKTATPQRYRSIFRKVISVGPLVAGMQAKPHGITFNSNFILIDLWVSATDTAGLTASIITDDNVSMDATNININSPAAYNVAFAFVEFIKEG